MEALNKISFPSAIQLEHKNASDWNSEIPAAYCVASHTSAPRLIGHIGLVLHHSDKGNYPLLEKK
jgi:hypothetical protein